MNKGIRPGDLAPGQTVEVENLESGVRWFAVVTQVQNKWKATVAPEGASGWPKLVFDGKDEQSGYRITRVIS